MPIREIDVARQQRLSVVEMYQETPKIMTAVTHADESDISEFHCVLTSTRPNIGLGNISSEGRPYSIKKIFKVPRQQLEIRMDKKYGYFYIIRVIPQFEIPLPDSEYYLIAHVNGRVGFLMPTEDLDKDEFIRKEIKEKLSA